MNRASEDRVLGGLRSLDSRRRRAAPRRGRPGRQMAASIVLPGVAALRRRTWFGLAALAVGVVLPVALVVIVIVRRADLIAVALSTWFLWALVAMLVLGVVSRLAAVIEVANWFRRSPGIRRRTALATLVVMALGLPVLWAGVQANGARQAVADVFGGSRNPVYESGAIDPAGGDIRSILLIGGDAGPGRWGMRSDTMILVQVHEDSGRVGLISVPRNLTRLRFPPETPLAGVFPEPGGFDDLANGVFTYVNTRPDLVEFYGADGLQPEAVALSGAIGYSLNVTIDDYALVNMQGFTELIDAVGGVTIDLPEAVPLASDVLGGEALPTTVGPGPVTMDGTMALAFVRSRKADSDYQRMERQRLLLAALGSQIGPSEAAGAFSSVTGLLGDSLRTSLSAAEFADLLDTLGDSTAIHESVGLVPPAVQPGSPDYDVIRQIVQDVRRSIVTG